MDPYTFNINSARELRLRRHIREVLLPYVRNHLTSDYVAFTEKVVEDLLLQTLEYVPMADATSFHLPTEPFEVLMHSLHSLKHSPPGERWATSSEHIRYLKTFFPPPPHPQDLPTEKCWFRNDHYEQLSLICRPISSPIISKRARRETPMLGHTNSGTFIPRTKPALAAFLDLDPIPVQGIQDLPTPPLDDVLDLRIKLDSETCTQIRPFLRLVSAPPKRERSIDDFEDTPNVPDVLSHDSPRRCIPGLDSPPLFPRITHRKSVQGQGRNNTKSGVYNPMRVSDLSFMLQVVPPELIDSEDGNINDYHMEVVNGWTTLTYSSPRSPSLHPSDQSEVDELWEISPPGTPPASYMTAKMDEIEIPRIRKFGHKNTMVGKFNKSTRNRGAAALLTAVTSPGFLITSFISAPVPTTLKPVTPQLEGVKIGMQPPHPLTPSQSTSNSPLGQPSSVREKQAKDKVPTICADCVECFEEQQLDDAVAGIYTSTPQDPLSYIIEERLDHKDIMLMDVPNLPPPTTHPRDPTLFARQMQSFVAPKAELVHLDTASHKINGVGPTAFLRPVKGIKPLALDLSWRPFNFGRTIPTDEEVAQVAKSIQPEDEGSGYRDKKYEETIRVLLDLATGPTLAEDAQSILMQKRPRGYEELGTSPTPKRIKESGPAEHLLTRRERMNASGVEFTLETEIGIQTDVDAEQGMTLRFSDDGHREILAQHEKLHHHEGQQGSHDLFDPLEYRSQRLTDNGYSFDDSGIDIVDPGQFSVEKFGVPYLFLHPFQDYPLCDVDAPGGNKNVDDQSENKENVPPEDLNDHYQAESQSGLPATQYDWGGCLEFSKLETLPFNLLSFPSQSQSPGRSEDITNFKVQGIRALSLSPCGVKRPKDPLASTNESEQTNSRVTRQRKLEDLVPASSKDLLSAFIGLRSQAISNRILEHSEIRNDTPTPHDMLGVPGQIYPRAIPDDVFDQHTLRLPELWTPAAAVHRYLASITLIQKRALVRELQGRLCRVDLVERYDLGGTDIIIDPDTGVLFIPLLALPAHLEATVERISLESWRYLNLLVVFEAFPSVQSFKVDCSRDSRPRPYAYTPPVCKAIKKLRRNLGIAEGCGTMNPRCTITWAFANDIEEAAKLVRRFGEEACTISKERGRGMLWDEREWLEEEEQEGESDLAGVHGMNAFAAFIMLYDRSIETILELSSEARLADFSHLLGEERMAALNAVIERRMQQIATDIVDLATDPGS